jgi:hypothetical protein
MVEHTQLPKFDAGNWVKVARLAVAASVALSAVTVAILLMVDPPNQCPNWHLKNTHSTSLWENVVMFTVPINIFCCFMAVRWNRFARSAIESEARRGAVRPYDPTSNSRDSHHGPYVRRDVFGFPISAVLVGHPMHRSLRP